MGYSPLPECPPANTADLIDQQGYHLICYVISHYLDGISNSNENARKTQIMKFKRRTTTNFDNTNNDEDDLHSTNDWNCRIFLQQPLIVAIPSCPLLCVFPVLFLLSLLRWRCRFCHESCSSDCSDAFGCGCSLLYLVSLPLLLLIARVHKLLFTEINHQQHH